MLIDRILRKLASGDVWRGLIYALTGVGITLSPEYIEVLTSLALGVSGLLHVIFDGGDD